MQPVLSPRTVHVHRLAAVGAMLTCIAVVLNIGPFAKAPTTGRLPAEGGGAAPTSLLDEPRSISQDTAQAPAETVQSAERSEDLPELIGALARPSPFLLLAAAPAESSSAAKPAEVGVDRQEAEPAPAAAPQQDEPIPDKPAIVGVWAPDKGTCSARDFQNGLLPTVITSEGAWAGDTFCMFTKRKETETGWTVVARCSTPRERWTSNVRLTVSENRLTWTSKRGSQDYTRCSPDILMAQAR